MEQCCQFQLDWDQPREDERQLYCFEKFLDPDRMQPHNRLSMVQTPLN